MDQDAIDKNYCPAGTTWEQHGRKRLDEDEDLAGRSENILIYGDPSSDAFWNWITVAPVREIVKWIDAVIDIGVLAAG